MKTDSPLAARQPFPFNELFGGAAGDADTPSAPPKSRVKSDTRKNKRKHISAYCTDLTARAREGSLDAIIGRDREDWPCDPDSFSPYEEQPVPDR